MFLHVPPLVFHKDEGGFMFSQLCCYEEFCLLIAPGGREEMRGERFSIKFKTVRAKPLAHPCAIVRVSKKPL